MNFVPDSFIPQNESLELVQQSYKQKTAARTAEVFDIVEKLD